MKCFIQSLVKFLVPTALFLLVLIVWDPFKVFFNYGDYYVNNCVHGNRELVCQRLLEKRDFKPVNFIIGSSRSVPYKIRYWARFISADPESCFHYDGSGMGLFRTCNALKYIAEKTSRIDNLLIIVDSDFFEEIENPSNHLFIQHPNASKQSSFNYYFTFLKASLNRNFLISNIVYKITGHFEEWMSRYISDLSFLPISDNLTGDLTNLGEIEIKIDSIKFYQKRLNQGIFFKKPSKIITSESVIGTRQMEMLYELKQVLVKSDTKVRIVISPHFNELKFNFDDLAILKNMFGKDAIYDFSGSNSITREMTSFYDASHCKPFVANMIMDSIYRSQE
jgi:hypothetical protein